MNYNRSPQQVLSLNQIVKVELIIPLILALVFFIYNTSVDLVGDWRFLTLIATIVAVYGLSLNILTSHHSINFVVVYGTYLSLSHLGLVIVESMRSYTLMEFASANKLGYWTIQWFYNNDMILQKAVALSGLGIVSFFLGASLYEVLGFSRKVSIPNLYEKGDQITFGIGLIMLIGCVGYSIYLGISTSFISSYGSYRNSIETRNFYSLYIFFFTTCQSFIVATASSKQFKYVIPFFLLASIILFVNGNRGEVLYGFASAIGVLGIRGLKINFYLIVGSVFIFFFLIPFVRQTRNISTLQERINNVVIDVREPFIELGFQIRPLILTIDWLENGEKVGQGGSYWLPTKRLIGAIIPFVERPSIEGSRFDIGRRLPGLGYTVIAEAYFNYKVSGVIVVMSSIACLLATLANSNSSRQLAVSGAVVAVLINNQRNSFIFVPGQLFLIFILFIIIIVFSRLGKIKL